jgi:alpha-L-rhamnosidase
VLEDVPGEYACPVMVQSADGLVHVMHTWRQQTVKHVVVN